MVTWNDEENRLLGERLLELRLASPIASLTELLTEAQAVLPEHRRRHVSGARQWKGLTPFIENYLARVGLGTVVEVVEVPVRELVEPVVADVLLSASLEDLVHAFSNRIMALSAVSAVQHMARVLAPESLHLDALQPPASGVVRPVKPERMRIAIVGPHRDQFEHIAAKTNGKAELVWLDKDHKRESFPNVDAIIVTQHTAHQHWEQARAAGLNTHFVDGGITGVVRKVFDLCSRQVSPEPVNK